MKKIILALTVISTLILFSSCQKDPDGGSPAPPADKIKTYTEAIQSGTFNFSTTYNLSYDGSNRIVGLTSTTDPGDKFIFAYPAANKFTVDIFGGNALVIHEDFYLNSKSQIDTTFQYNDTEDTSTEKYLYNAKDEVAKTFEYEYSKITGSDLINTITYTYDAGGNLLKTEDTDNNVDIYEYYPDLVNTLPSVYPFASTKKLNLVKKHSLTSGGTLQGTATYTYTFDSNNRISIEKAVTDNGTTVTKTYTYF